MYVCTDKAKVDAIYNEKKPRDLHEVMREVYPEATFDGARYHAPCDGFECPLTGNVYRGGEYLPMQEEGKSGPAAKVSAAVAGTVETWVGTLAQVSAVREELKAQTIAFDASRSNYVGYIGGKISVEAVLETLLKFDGFYGLTFLHIFKEAMGNVVVYKGSKRLGERGTTVCFTAKVKAHAERDGVKQTIVERPKLAS